MTSGVASKILIPTSEYRSLKATKDDVSRAATDKALADVAKTTIVDDINETRRRDLTEEDEEEGENGSKTAAPNKTNDDNNGVKERADRHSSEEEEEDDDDDDDVGRAFANLLPTAKKARAAQKFMWGLIKAPEVDCRNSIIYVKGREIGHVIWIVTVLFENEAKMRARKRHLNNYLRHQTKITLPPNVLVRARNVDDDDDDNIGAKNKSAQKRKANPSKGKSPLQPARKKSKMIGPAWRQEVLSKYLT